MPRLALAQPLRRSGAIEQQIGREIFLDFGRDRAGRIGHAVDDRIGQPRQRHLRRIDHLPLRLPFRGNRLRKRQRRRGEQPARRRAHRLVVERSPHSRRRPPAAVAMRIETPPQRRPRAAARRRHRIVGVWDGLEQIAHRQTFNPIYSMMLQCKSQRPVAQSEICRASPVLPNRALVNDHQRQNLVITSRSGGNPCPSRLVSGAGFGYGAAGERKSTQQRAYRQIKSGCCVQEE